MFLKERRAVPLLLAIKETYADVICKFKVQTTKQMHAGMSRRRSVIYRIRESTVDSRRVFPRLFTAQVLSGLSQTLEFAAYSAIPRVYMGLPTLYMTRGAASTFLLMNTRNRIKSQKHTYRSSDNSFQ